MRKTFSRIAGAVVGAGVLATLAAPQALAASAPVTPVTAVTTQLPAGADPSHWVIDRKAPAAALPQASAPTRITPTRKSPELPAEIFNEVRDVAYHGQLCGTDVIDANSGPGPMTLTLTQTRSTATQWTASASIDVWKISAGVNFNVTDTVTNTESGSYTVPDGKFGNLQAYQLFDYYTYSIYNNQVGAYVGDGEVKKPVGFCYNAWTN
ncbi:hypothetical protein [Kitasatospora sp. NPDC056531]|uniref:hypothetical protein n=1 Tax=Kitasatospora sp. NPDC056531 TaxID=3345856 RepID=UPI0036ACA3D9